MNLADELMGVKPQVKPHPPGKIVSLLEPWPEESVRLSDLPRRQRKVELSALVKTACEELGSGITSAIVSRLWDIDLPMVSSYLGVMQRRGLLVVEGEIKRDKAKGGRPMKVYRWVGA